MSGNGKLVVTKELQMGVDSLETTELEQESRVAVLRATVEKYIPEFVSGVAETVKINADLIASGKSDNNSWLMLHQDAFAAGYDDDEYILFGMALKYAGLYGVSVIIAGKEDN